MALRVIIVEDDAPVALQLEAILQDAGHVVVGMATSMAAAMRFASADPNLNLAIMDVDLAGGPDGVEVARRLREDHGVASLFVSAWLNEATRMRALAWKPVGFIGKPFQEEAVLQALEAMPS